MALLGPAAWALADDASVGKARLVGLASAPAALAAEGDRDRSRLLEDTDHRRYARYDEGDLQRARRVVGAVVRADPGLKRQLESVPGYVVFAEVGTHGSDCAGVLYEDGQAAGKAMHAWSPVTLRPDGQPYAEVVLLGTRRAVAGFKQGGLAPADQARAVAVVAGTTTSVRYHEGVSVLTLGREGGVAGPGEDRVTFGYLPYHRQITAGAR